MRVRQDAPANTPDHQSVPGQQAREGNLIAAADKAFQQFRIACRGAGLQARQAPNVAKQRVQLPSRQVVKNPRSCRF